MSNKANGQVSATSPVATELGIVQLPELSVPANRIYNFVEMYRKAYFEDHSLDWALDEIITRGMAEIKRTVKNQVKTAENRAAGTVLRTFGMTPDEAQRFIAHMKELEALKAKAEAKA
jgi:hypothetical protein